MSGTDEQHPEGGWGLSSEHEQDQVQEVDSRSVDYDDLREVAKDPEAAWSHDEGDKVRHEEDQ